VVDDGEGIEPEVLGRVFERLFTSRRDETRRAGTGLGLAIVAELTEAMGGTVRARSPLDERGGTAVDVELPRHVVLGEQFHPTPPAD
jgi:signal transduction histidine kinase